MLEIKGIFIIITVFLLLGMVMLNIKHSTIIVSSLTSKENKPIHLSFIIIVLLFWFFAICVKDSHDIYYYRYAYNGMISHGKEPLFDIITQTMSVWGWSFDSFKALWITIISILLYRGIKQYGENHTATAALFLVSPATLYITGMRSSMVGAIMLNAFPLLMTKRKIDRIYFFCIVVMCAQIHIVSYVYLMFLFEWVIRGKSIRKIYYIVIFTLTACAILFSSSMSANIESIVGNIFKLLGDSSSKRASSYFGGEGNHLRYEIYLVVKHIFMFYLTEKACDFGIQNVSEKSISYKKYGLIKRLNSLLLVLLPITVLSASFERIFSYFLLIQYSVIFDVKYSKKRFSYNTNLSLRNMLQSILCLGIVSFTIIEVYFSSNDLIRILNSVKLSFKS